jgi:hypothetical protein
METDKKKKNESLGWFCHAIRDNLDYMLKELPTLKVPEDIRTPIRYALSRAKRRCNALADYAQKIEYVLGVSPYKPRDLDINPPDLRRDVGLMLNTLAAQVEELTSMMRSFQETYRSYEDYYSLAPLSVLLHESVGNILYLRMRMRYQLTHSLSLVTDAAGQTS